MVLLCLVAAFNMLAQAALSNLPGQAEPGSPVVLKGIIKLEAEWVVSEDVVIYPDARIQTTESGRIVFRGAVDVLGSSPVFHSDAKIDFRQANIGIFNVRWFGARGSDGEDDTPAFQKVLSIARDMPGSVTIIVPAGKYLVRESLLVSNAPHLNKAINLRGEGMSASTNDGSSLIWMGAQGASLVKVEDVYLSRIEGIDFAAEPGHELKHNLELRPQVYQFEIRDCSFSGCAGTGSANVNLNAGDSRQVSEVSIRNCIFRGLTRDNKVWQTDAAVLGGRGNTKNFYLTGCSFLGYREAAIDIEISDVVHVTDCAFAHNTVDIRCLLCNLYASANYSEQSRTFYTATNSSNLAFATLIGNYFDGHPEEDYVIPGGTGSLVLINNNFGGNGGTDTTNLIRWSGHNVSNITSIGNFFRNHPGIQTPFRLDGSGPPDAGWLRSEMDKIGLDGHSSRSIKN